MITHDTLWLKVSDEVGIPAKLSSAEEHALAALFDAENPSSAWSCALARLGFTMPWNAGPVLRFVSGVPYFNGTLLSAVSSQGTVEPRPADDGGVIYASRLGLFGLLRMLIAHWKLELFLKSDTRIADPLEESIVLGLAIQALVQRLPAKGELETAAWLADPTRAPAPLRSTLSKILSLQRRRNALSPAWHALFRGPAGVLSSCTLPTHFWNEPPATLVRTQDAGAKLGKPIKGIPICPGQTEGLLFLVEDLAAAMPEVAGGLVLLFPKARPETTELFSKASAVLFGEGGALSHACSVARESGVITVSGLGRDFVQAARAWAAEGKKIRVSVDGNHGEILAEEIM